MRLSNVARLQMTGNKTATRKSSVKLGSVARFRVTREKEATHKSDMRLRNLSRFEVASEKKNASTSDVMLSNVARLLLAIIGEKDTHDLADGNLEAITNALAGGGNQDYRVEKLPGLNHFLQTAPTGAPSEYGKIQQPLAPAALEIISNWILEHFE